MTSRLRLQRAWKIVRGPAIITAAYLVLQSVFGIVTEDNGLLTPSGKPGFGVAALGLVVLLLRLAVLFVMPMVIAWRAVRALFRDEA